SAYPCHWAARAVAASRNGFSPPISATHLQAEAASSGLSLPPASAVRASSYATSTLASAASVSGPIGRNGWGASGTTAGAIARVAAALYARNRSTDALATASPTSSGVLAA